MWSNSNSFGITASDVTAPVLLPLFYRVTEWKPKPGVLTPAR